MSIKVLTQQRLKEVLCYDPATGIFTWLKNRKHAFRMKAAGWLCGTGYLVIDVDGLKYRAHRLAWLYVHGLLPPFVDHKNLIRTDNRISNLRICSKSQNNANSRVRNSSASGIKGVYFHKLTQRWHAYITVHQKRHHLGCFATSDEASAAYFSAAKKHFGEFARAA